MLYANLLLIGAAQGFFLSLLLFRSSRASWEAGRVLALLTFFFSLDLAVNYCSAVGLSRQYPRLVFVEVLVVFLYGPLLYLAVTAFTASPKLLFGGRRWPHFLPFLLALPLLLPVFLLEQESLRAVLAGQARLRDYIDGWAPIIALADVLPRMLIGVYLILCFREIRSHGRVIRDNFSEIESISLGWLRLLLAGFAVLYVLYLIAFGAGDASAAVERTLNVAMAILVYALGYRGLRQPVIFSETSESTESQDDPTSDFYPVEVPVVRRKYEGSALDEAASKALFCELEELMADSAAYLEPDLTLRSLAARLRLPPNYLSQAINQQAGCNFYDYVNAYRIETAKAALRDAGKRSTSVLTIASDAGFNSKSAFYATFKEHVGMTPTQFRKAGSS
ncbi:helix-turn-helix transcriptional regulator [Pseudohaliea sp.]|uniref:helix-turn-helix domain-containing protein n=1 Tax=Pseudohaliea sp. TaxID=2740289 RepID=UPI0032EDF259